MKIHIPHTRQLPGFAALPLLLALAFRPSPTPAQTCIGAQGVIQWHLYENNSGGDLRTVYTHPSFPQRPDWSESIVNLATPANYNNNYGSLIRGYLKAPLSGPYVFNLTGDDRSLFYLSADTLRDLLPLRAEVPSWTNTDEHGKFPEQTSDTIELVANSYYYFEMHQKEGGGGDFIWLYWKTPATIGSATWNVIPGASVYECLCEPLCPKAGTPCSDGNAGTLDDQQDGNCHCSGTPAPLPFACIGERGSLMALYYDGITGSFVSSLFADPDYPLSPNRAHILPSLKGPLTTGTNYGTRIRGYLRPPETGNYIFNVTGDNEVKLRLSPNENTTAADEIAFNDGYTDPFDHTNTADQTSDTLLLQGGVFYSIEMFHKESTGGDYFNVFWKTPFPRDTFWHVVDGSFLYRYACETACVPAGTPCSDGSANTFNDVYNASCACAGTACSDPACTNSLGYTPLEPCDSETDRHSTSLNQSWLSCQPTQSPNPARGVSHWILYDFGDVFALDDAQIWNYNALGASLQGFHDVVIDFSFNGTWWTELGQFTWSQASGTPAYEGFDFTAFNGVSARYVLITALSNFGGANCAGLSEVLFNATTCPDAGTPCDDGLPETSGDAWNEYCHCMGIPTGTNECDSVHLTINEVPVTGGKHDAQLTITSSGTVWTGYNVNFIAGESVTLNAEFEVELGAEFLAAIAPCAAASADKPDGKKKGKKKRRSRQD